MQKNAYFLINVSIQAELASGTFLQANAAALITKSLTDIFTLSLANCSLRSFRTLKPREKYALKKLKISNEFKCKIT